MSQNILFSIKQCLKKTLKIMDLEIDDCAILKDDFGLDSMSTLTFLLELEDAIDGFNVDADSLEPDNLMTVKTVYDYVLKHMPTENEDVRCIYH